MLHKLLANYHESVATEESAWWLLALCLFGTTTVITLINTTVMHVKTMKGRQFDDFVVAGGTLSCRNDNLRCHQWRQTCQIDDLLFSVNKCGSFSYCVTMSPHLVIQPADRRQQYPRNPSGVREICWVTMGSVGGGDVCFPRTNVHTYKYFVRPPRCCQRHADVNQSDAKT